MDKNKIDKLGSSLHYFRGSLPTIATKSQNISQQPLLPRFTFAAFSLWTTWPVCTLVNFPWFSLEINKQKFPYLCDTSHVLPQTVTQYNAIGLTFQASHASCNTKSPELDLRTGLQLPIYRFSVSVKCFDKWMITFITCFRCLFCFAFPNFLLRKWFQLQSWRAHAVASIYHPQGV